MAKLSGEEEKGIEGNQANGFKPPQTKTLCYVTANKQQKSEARLEYCTMSVFNVPFETQQVISETTQRRRLGIEGTVCIDNGMMRVNPVDLRQVGPSSYVCGVIQRETLPCYGLLRGAQRYVIITSSMTQHHANHAMWSLIVVSVRSRRSTQHSRPRLPSDKKCRR